MFQQDSVITDAIEQVPRGVGNLFTGTQKRKDSNPLLSLRGARRRLQPSHTSRLGRNDRRETFELPPIKRHIWGHVPTSDLLYARCLSCVEPFTQGRSGTGPQTMSAKSSYCCGYCFGSSATAIGAPDCLLL